MGKAADAARWRGDDEVWLDHATLADGDGEWLAPVRVLTLWAVKVPDGLLASLPNLVFLDLRGGSGTSVGHVAGCAGLRYLAVNQVRGLTDLSVVPTLTTLELLDLYGLPRVTEIPSLAPLGSLRRVVLGSMKGLRGLTGLPDAPALEELVLARAVGTAGDDAERLAAHPALARFYWFAEDVPDKVWVPFRDAVGLPPAASVLPRDWFAQRGGL